MRSVAAAGIELPRVLSRITGAGCEFACDFVTSALEPAALEMGAEFTPEAAAGAGVEFWLAD